MLPKLQQSSLAQSLRRDNPASHLQCNSLLMQARISLEALSTSKPTKTTNPGRTTTPRKTPTPASGTSPKSTSPRRNSRTPPTSPTTSSHFPAHSPSTLATTVTEAELAPLCRKRPSSRNQYPSQVPSRRGTSPPQNLEGTTIGVTCPSGLTTRTPFPNWSGKSQ